MSEKENGKFYFHDEDIPIMGGARSPNVIFKLTLEYKGNKISIINRTGTTYVGNITCKLSETIQPLEFELSSISHFKNLFLKRKNRFVIKTKNKSLASFFRKNTSLNKLGKIAQKENFSPLITCKEGEYWTIETKYHLEFDNWTEVIEPLIELYKNLIDEFEKRV